MSENKTERFFNTTGPVDPGDHYHINSLERIDLNAILSLIAQKKYFVLHAPRQTGKTSLLIALMNYLNNQGQYKTLYVNIEAAQAARENVSEGMQTILITLAQASVFYLKDSFFKDNWKQIFAGSVGLFALYASTHQHIEFSLLLRVPSCFTVSSRLKTDGGFEIVEISLTFFLPFVI